MNQAMRILILLTAILLCSSVHSSKILGIFWSHSRSQHILGSALCKELARRGHDVTYLSPFMDDVDIENFKQIQLFGILDSMNSVIKTNISFWDAMMAFPYIAKENSKKFWRNDAVQTLIKSREKFDVVIMYSVFSDSMLALSHHLGAPTIIFTGSGANSLVNKYVANPNLPYSTNLFKSEGTPDTFFGRVLSVAMICLLALIEKFILNPTQEQLIQEHLPDSPSLQELEKNVSLVFVNSHHSIEQPRPYVPNMVQIGGFYAQKVQDLPNDLEEFLNSAKHGAILFSFGTNIKMAKLDDDKIRIFLKGLGKVAPIKVILKSEIDLDDVPANILVKKWLPQNDILAHRNMKAFVSHGGLGSTTEAVYHGVPILGIPLIADQKTNMDIATKSEYATKLLLDDMTQEKFDAALGDVLSNPKYRSMAKQRSSLLRNQPMDPMDKAIWWVEHIIEFKGGRHLRNSAMDLEWYQLYMVDIVLFVTSILLLSTLISYLTLAFFFKRAYAFVMKRKVEKIKES